MRVPETLGACFYDRDPCEVAVDLIGCVLVSESPDGSASGVIVETEAYRPDDPACHAYENRVTMRNRTIFSSPGVAYVYLSYGIHRLLNVVCEPEGVGGAVLIRALIRNPVVEYAYAKETRVVASCEHGRVGASL